MIRPTSFFYFTSIIHLFFHTDSPLTDCIGIQFDIGQLNYLDDIAVTVVGQLSFDIFLFQDERLVEDNISVTVEEGDVENVCLNKVLEKVASV